MHTAIYENVRSGKQAIKYNKENNDIHEWKYLSACAIYRFYQFPYTCKKFDLVLALTFDQSSFLYE